MAKECFNCVEPAVNQWTLALDDDTVLENVITCNTCIKEFIQTDWIEIYPEKITR